LVGVLLRPAAGMLDPIGLVVVDIRYLDKE